MTAFNVVRFKVKPGRDEEFIGIHKVANRGFPGMRKFSMFGTGPGSYCVVGEWESFDALAAARTNMIGLLDSFRHLLEDLGGGIGVTDPVSGTAIVEMGPAKQRKAKAKNKPAKRASPAKKKTTKPAKKKSAKKRR